jgi:uncharacterized membrane protein YuzA (DUF378 family)
MKALLLNLPESRSNRLFIINLIKKNMCNGKCGGGCAVKKTAKILLIIGGLNWGLVGLQMLFASGSNWDVVNLLLGSWPVVEGVVYLLVGIAALIKIFGCRCKKCKATCAACKAGNTEGMDMEKKM